jgi:GntR family transcriptional regulator
MQKLSVQHVMTARPVLAGPLYHQIHELIRDRITSGEWSGTQSLPNEADLAREYRVSVGTMRKALELLGQSKLITRKQGLGTFVNSQAMDPALRFSSWVEGGNQQHETTLRVLSAAVDVSSEDIAERLGLKKRSAILRLEVLNAVGTQGASINTYLLPTRLFEDFQGLNHQETIDAVSILREVMTRAAQCIDLIDVAKVYGSQAELLGVGDETPVLKIERTGYDAENSKLFLCTKYTRLNGAHYSATVR